MPKTIPALSNHPDQVILELLASFQKFALAMLLLTAGVTLLAWLIPSFALLLPAGWDRMKFNTAFLMLLAAASIFLSRPRQSTAAVLASRLLGWFIVAIAALTFIECNSTRSFHIDTLFAADRFAAPPGRMLPEFALCLVLTGFLLANIRARKNSLALMVDVATLLLCALLLLQTSGFIMQHLHVIQVPAGHSISAPSALCFALLGLLIFNRRVEYNWFAVLLGAGIGGRVARIAVPIAVAIPFALDSVQGFLVAHVKAASPQLLSGLGATGLSVTSLCFVLLLSRRIDNLENQVRELSLRDELTGLYNRRGFYFLAEQALRTARRDGKSFSICYFDLDGLKHINDTQGHDVGSMMLQEMAQLMELVFRESDILGRIGGDEFIAACKGDQTPELRLAAQAAAAQHANQRGGRSYVLSYSVGVASSDADSKETLEKLVERADREMYEAKHNKKGRSPRSQGSLSPELP